MGSLCKVYSYRRACSYLSGKSLVPKANFVAAGHVANKEAYTMGRVGEERVCCVVKIATLGDEM
jgi:hypothetical protein